MKDWPKPRPVSRQGAYSKSWHGAAGNRAGRRSGYFLIHNDGLPRRLGNDYAQELEEGAWSVSRLAFGSELLSEY